MSNRTDILRWLCLGGALLLLTIAYFLPRHNSTADQVNRSVTAVPSELSAPKSDAVDSPSPAPTAAIVYVCGAVKKPGVYRLTPAARVNDALGKAGGPTAEADLEQLNLAAVVNDGMKIQVPHKGQLLPAEAGLMSSSQLTSQPGLTSTGRHRGGSGRHKLQPGQTLNVNTASEQELTTLPGVGPGLARRIVEYRTANGPFQAADDLQNVSGIGPSKFDKLISYIKL